MRAWLGSLVFTTWLFLSVALWGVVVVVLRFFGYPTAYRGILLWVDTTLWLLERLCGLSHEVHGLDKLPSGPCVIMMKHSSAWETIAQLRMFPRQTWVMKRELLWAPVLGWVLWGLKPIAIDRGGGRQAVEQVIRLGRQRLAKGFWVVIFPEGTRMPAGTTRRYGVSGTLLADAADVPIVPVAHDAGYFWPRRGVRKKPGRIRVVIGDPVRVGGRDPREFNAGIQRWIEAEVAAMRGP